MLFRYFIDRGHAYNLRHGPEGVIEILISVIRTWQLETQALRYGRTIAPHQLVYTHLSAYRADRQYTHIGVGLLSYRCLRYAKTRMTGKTEMRSSHLFCIHVKHTSTGIGRGKTLNKLMKHGFMHTLAAIGLLAATAACGGPDSSVENYVNTYQTAKIVPVRVRETFLYGYLDHEGNVAIEPVYLTASSFHDGLALVTDSATSLKGYIDMEGRWVIEPAFESASDFNEGVAWVAQPDSCLRLIDRKGNVKFKFPQAMTASVFAEGIAEFTTADDSWGYVNKKGESRLFDEKITKMLLPADGYIIYYDSLGNVCVGKLDGLELNPVKKPEGMNVEAVSIKYRQMIIRVDDKYGLIDFDGKMIVNPRYKGLQFDSDDMIIAMNEKDKIGWLNTKGEEVIPMKYKKAAFLFSDGKGYAGVSVSGTKFQIIDREGKTCVPAKYSKIGSTWTPGLFFVCKDDEWGIVDKDGKVVCDPQFKSIAGAAKGMFMATSGDGKWGVIGENGTYRSPIIYDEPFTARENVSAAESRLLDTGLVADMVDKLVGDLTFDTDFGTLADRFGLTLSNIIGGEDVVRLSKIGKVGVGYELTVGLNASYRTKDWGYRSYYLLNRSASPKYYSLEMSFDAPRNAKAVYESLGKRDDIFAPVYTPENMEDVTGVHLVVMPEGKALYYANGDVVLSAPSNE